MCNDNPIRRVVISVVVIVVVLLFIGKKKGRSITASLFDLLNFKLSSYEDACLVISRITIWQTV